MNYYRDSKISYRRANPKAVHPIPRGNTRYVDTRSSKVEVEGTVEVSVTAPTLGLLQPEPFLKKFPNVKLENDQRGPDHARQTLGAMKGRHMAN